MDLPLVLVLRRDGVLVYRIPYWFRAVMGLIFAAVAAALAFGGSDPGIVGWIVATVLLLSFLYEESWVFDKEKGEIRHRFGLLVAARRLVIPLAGVSGFRLVPWVRGGIPGSAEEKADNKRTLEASRGGQADLEEGSKKKALYKKPYLTLVCEGAEEAVTINMVPARRASAFRALAERIAQYCGKALAEG